MRALNPVEYLTAEYPYSAPESHRKGRQTHSDKVFTPMGVTAYRREEVAAIEAATILTPGVKRDAGLAHAAKSVGQ